MHKTLGWHAAAKSFMQRFLALHLCVLIHMHIHYTQWPERSVHVALNSVKSKAYKA